MEKIELVKKIARWIVLIFGFGLVLGGAYGLDYIADSKKQYIPVTGTIKNIQRFQGEEYRKKISIIM